MPSIRSIINYIKTRFQRFRADWRSMDVSYKGAIVAAFIGVVSTLAVTALTDWLERKRAEDEQSSTEQNKMKYLHFLVEDSFKTIASYTEHAKKLESNFKQNPFDIPDANLYVGHSLNTIANKINQEDYYLASVNQIKNDSINELLLMYNTLDKSYSLATQHYQNQVPLLVADKDKYKAELNGLIESVNIYLLSYDSRKLKGVEKVIYDQINTLMGEFTVFKNSTSTDQILRDSESIYVNKLIVILDPKGAVTHRPLMRQAYGARKAYLEYVGRMAGVVESADFSQRIMNSLVYRIKTFGKPLHDYVINLDK